MSKYRARSSLVHPFFLHASLGALFAPRMDLTDSYFLVSYVFVCVCVRPEWAMRLASLG